MFGSTHVHSTAQQSDENAVAAANAAARTAKPSLVSGKPALTNSTPAKPATKHHATPARANILTPNFKSQQGLKRMRAATPVSLRGRDPVRTIKKSKGLFTPRKPSVVLDETLLMLEPEYVPPRPISPELSPIDEFGVDLDVALIPLEQKSHVGTKVRKLQPLELEPERMREIEVLPVSFSRIPKPSASLSSMQIKVRLRELVGADLVPTRIPRLKSKRL
ncbi:hypothetical protein FBU59_005111 [Linderina macrospora]|uniref:Uncharacterized protein n=1 Tax=Linderina macrospora TaxID=4868 RepID=A0ACC1J3W3_9FUNG|nr:hypothetical protein FBU59_005111 [Linderina macrospora]